MVLVESVDSFVEQAEALYKQNPLKSRYVIKYSHCKGKLTLKVTDDRNTVQYKTDQQIDLKKIEKLNSRLIHLMATGDEPPEEEAAEASQHPPPQSQKPRRQPPQEQGSRSKKTRRKG